MKKELKNRYGDIYTFTLDKRKNILVTGPFRWMRWGFKNDYKEAYSKYKEDNPTDFVSFDNFVNEIHYYDADTFEKGQINKEYAKYVTSTKELSMIDPSGGPYLCVGMHLKEFGVKIKRIKSLKSGYKLYTECLN